MIGRKYEREKLDCLTNSSKAELLTIIGRRRVGKTYLIREHYKDRIVFEFTGTQYSNKKNQLKKFAQKLQDFSGSSLKIATSKDWSDAFTELKTYLKTLPKTENKPVVFFDEVPWIASKRSGFLNEFSYWWNDWASRQNMIVVICGSAASWMIGKVVNNKGGLHNRITEYIHLQPFTLCEVKQYLDAINLRLDDYQILQLYMSIGGIPHYLQHIRKGESATQIINRLCFNKDGILRNEFNNLYAALYEGHERHVAVVRALSSKWKGLTRKEIIKLTKLSNGGGLTQVLTELISSSFVAEIIPFGKKKKDTLYRLIDEYSLFYLTFIEGKRVGKKDIWLQNVQDNSYKIWRGYAFENICIKHVEAIKQALGISGVQTEVSGFRKMGTANEKGIQIDMLIDRNDRCINLCEMKFYNDELTLSKEDAAQLRRRRSRFQQISKTKKTVFNTIVTTYGLVSNTYSYQVDSVVTIDALFLLESFE
ncbi:MAG: ATP-binding protein [Chitinophagales bacterium]